MVAEESTPTPIRRTRRGNGEGTISRRTDGRWAGAVQVDGRRHWVYATTHRKAQVKLAELRRQLDRT
jgi:hypothetical protein